MEVLDKFGQRYVPSEQWPLPEWPCMLPRQALPSLTLKADDLFLITIWRCITCALVRRCWIWSLSGSTAQSPAAWCASEATCG
jgi:hypothetical protein